MFDRLFVSDLSKCVQLPKHCRKTVIFRWRIFWNVYGIDVGHDVGSATFVIFEYGEDGVGVLRP